jgi:hypothetical protein
MLLAIPALCSLASVPGTRKLLLVCSLVVPPLSHGAAQ